MSQLSLLLEEGHLLLVGLLAPSASLGEQGVSNRDRTTGGESAVRLASQDYLVYMNPGRRILELFSRGRVLKRRPPPDFYACPILVSPDASLRYWKAGIESDLFDYAREFVQPGSIVWDIGSNVGVFA